MSPRLSETVSVARRFTRAVRVDADLNNPAALDGYVCSQSAVEALLLMARHQQATGQGAFTWTGPYGSGKSSLAIALATLTAGTPHSRTKLLTNVGEADQSELSKGFRPTRKPWLVVAAVGRRDDPSQALGEALAVAVKDWPDLAQARRETFAAWASRIAKDSRHAGLLILVDEMGKFLEHAARSDGDVHVFQDLAETASRSDGRLLVVGILHQAFDEYAHRLAREARDEWIKIQGRFLDVPINLAAEEQLDLIGRAIQSDRPSMPSWPAAAAVAAMVANPRVTDKAALQARLEACWPLHPIVAALLGPVSRRRFGQNQRSLFGFLNSAEPFGFRAYLAETDAQDAEPFAVGRLWDYLHANLEPAILASPDGHRWSTALEALARAEARGGGTAHLELLKAIALIDLFKDRSGLHATPDLLAHVINEGQPKEVARLLEDLASWSVIIFRKHVGAYGVYAGSDFDIDTAIDQARDAGVNLDYRQLARYAVLQPILAKRHYDATGALRWFEIELTALADLEDRVRSYRPAPGAAGLFLLVISGEAESQAQAQVVLKRAATQADDRLIIAGWTSDSFMIREMASDLAALEYVRAHRPELEGDAIARREVDARLARLSADLEDRMAGAVHRVKWHPPAGVDATISLQLSGPAGLSVLASRLADWRYPAAPRLPNELVNRSKPSSNAAAAVRALLRAMIEQRGEERLGMTGFPAEAGLYVGLLEATGLHRDGENGWGFYPPESDQPHRLDGLWAATDRWLTGAAGGMTAAEIYQEWKSPPFGLREGLCNVLFTAYLLTRSATSAVYLEGVFRPTLDTFVIDRLVQDPSCIRVRSIELTDVDVAFISALADRLSTPDEIVPPTAFEVARAVIREIKGLPNWSLRTASLSASTTALRDKAKTSDDPNRLITIDIPRAFGWSDGEYAGPALARQVIGALDELKSAYQGMLSSLKASLFTEVRVEDEALALDTLHARAVAVKGLTGNFRLDALATRLSTFEGRIDEVEGLASLAANKPPREWVDRDVDAARVELAALSQQFLKAEIVQHLKGRDGGRLAMAVYISDPRFPEPRAREIEISTKDRALADELAARMREVLSADNISLDVAFAALASLGLTLSETEQPKKRKALTGAPS